MAHASFPMPTTAPSTEPMRRTRTAAPTEILGGAIMAAGFVVWMVKPVGDIRLVILGYLLVLLSCSLIVLTRGIWIDRTVAGLWLATFIVSGVGALIGIERHNIGAISEILFFVVLPTVWFVLSFGITLSSLQFLTNVIPFIGVFVGVLGTFYWLDATGRGSFPWVYVIDLGQGIGRTDYGYQLRFYPISTLVFLLPFLTMALFNAHTFTWSVSRRLAPIALLLLFLLLLVAGRRALLLSLCVALALGAMLFLTHRFLSSQRRRIVLVSGLLVTAFLLGSSIAGFSIRSMISSVTSDELSSDSLRAQSAVALTSSWAESPIVGNGLGDIVEGTPRSIERPWDFELQYLLIANALGLVGLAVFGIGTIVLVARVRQAILGNITDYQFLIPTVVGSLSLLTANATNPYMHTPGNYWMFFVLVLALSAMHRHAADRAGPALHRFTQGP